MEGKLNKWIKLFKSMLKGHQTLFIIDDCSAEGEINKKRDALLELAFSDQHRNHSLWVLTQKYNSVSKDVREQIKWLCLFFTKDQDSFEDCLRENDVKDKRNRLKKCLQDRPYSKLIFEMLPTHWLSFAISLLIFVVQLVNICYKFANIC